MTNEISIRNDDELKTRLEPEKPMIRVMIADDHPIVRDGIRRLLSLEEDIEVVGEAGDGREVLRTHSEHRS